MMFWNLPGIDDPANALAMAAGCFALAGALWALVRHLDRRGWW